MPATFPRALGVLTAAYGALVLVKPSALTRPAELQPTPRNRRLARGLGVRDLVCGVAMATAPVGDPLRAAMLTRVGFDLTDAVTFGTLSATPRARFKCAVVATGWAALCASSLPHTSAQSRR